ncbi:MAG: YihY/virulence factor BrkB family protein [Bradyrhizobiaceae bacterium]|nr:YihY/virulence factor BrkB family protein [Bradyrhizobiaceae bacterium]
MKNIKPWIKHYWGLAVELVDITEQRHIFLLAAGIAFNQMLCLLPTVLLAISMLSGLIDEKAMHGTLTDLVTQLVPGNLQAASFAQMVVRELDAVISYRTVAGWIAGIALLWLASALFGAMRSGLNAIFHIPTPKLFILYKVKDLLLTIVVAFLILLATMVTPLISLLELHWHQALEAMNMMWLDNIGARLTSIIITSVLFLVLYRFVPNKRLPWQIGLLSTVFAVVFWELARLVFTWYVNNTTNLSLFYGGYLALASLALWFYYSSFIFLFAAELAQFIYTRRHEHRSPTP